MFRSKAFRFTLLTLLGLALVWVLFRNQLINLFIEPLAKRVIQGRELTLEEGLNVVLIGTGSPMPDINRAGPCIAVIAGKHFFVVDAGDASARNVSLAGLNTRDISGVLLTHFHSDHIGGLGEMMLQRWASGGHRDQLPVYGPRGVEEVVRGFNMAYALDKGYRVAHHGAEVVPPSGSGGLAKTIDISDSSDASTVFFEKDGLRITAFNVDHHPIKPAVGYRFEYMGKSIVISGDTRYSANLARHAQNADLLFHEALNAKLVGLIERYSPNGGTVRQIAHDIPDYHTTPVEVARIARDAHVKNVVLYHIIPPLPSKMLEEIYLEGCSEIYSGPIKMGVDGLLVHLPPGGNKVKYRHLIK